MTKVGKCEEFCDNIKSDYAMLICENLTVEKEVYANVDLRCQKIKMSIVKQN